MPIKQLVSNKTILDKAKDEHYAVGGFNFNNLEFLQGIIEGAVEMKSPLILQAASSQIDYMGANYVVGLVEAALKDIDIPVSLHLDHGGSLETVMKCIELGFSSVMFDGSKYPYRENIRLTKKVVEIAHDKGISVEAELGKIGGTEDDVSVDLKSASFTDPDEAAEFVEKTGIDALAISIGTAHGVYKGIPKLDFERLKIINSRLDIPLVLHGASGVSDEDIKKAVSLGINKVNIHTDYMLVFTKAIKDLFETNPEVYDLREYCALGKEAIKLKAIEKIKLLGSNIK